MAIKRLELQIPHFLKGKLIKDLHENEVICEHCGGTGLEIYDNVYGIKGEVGFNYMKQSLGYCHHCYNGVRRKCEFCGRLLPRGSNRCGCDGYKEYEHKQTLEREEKIFNKAKKMTYEEYIEKYPNHFLYYNDHFYSDLEDMKEDYEDWELGELPKYVYGTYTTHMIVDIDSAIESACDELHEDAIYGLEGEDELYDAIDNFIILNKEHTTTFYPDYSVVILI